MNETPMNKIFKDIIGTLNYEKLIILLLFASIAPYLFLALFSVPSADDFSQAFRSMDQGILGFVSSRYLNWSGRYSSDLIISTFNVLGSQVNQYFLIKFYYIVPVLILFTYSISSYCFVSLLSRESPLKWRIVFALLSTVLMLSYVELRSTVFWLAGGATYTLGNSLFLISLAITLSLVFIENVNRKLLLLATVNSFLIFFLNGFNEIIMICNTVVISGLLLCSYLLRSLKGEKYWNLLAFEAFSIISTLIVVFAPGNAVRASQDAQKVGLLKVAIRSLWAMVDSAFHWINPVWICFCIVLFFISRYFISGKLELYIRDERKFFPLVASLFLALTLCDIIHWAVKDLFEPVP